MNFTSENNFRLRKISQTTTWLEMERPEMNRGRLTLSFFPHRLSTGPFQRKKNWTQPILSLRNNLYFFIAAFSSVLLKKPTPFFSLHKRFPLDVIQYSALALLQTQQGNAAASLLHGPHCGRVSFNHSCHLANQLPRMRWVTSLQGQSVPRAVLGAQKETNPASQALSPLGKAAAARRGLARVCCALGTTASLFSLPDPTDRCSWNTADKPF